MSFIDASLSFTDFFDLDIQHLNLRSVDLPTSVMGSFDSLIVPKIANLLKFHFQFATRHIRSWVKLLHQLRSFVGLPAFSAFSPEGHSLVFVNSL